MHYSYTYGYQTHCSVFFCVLIIYWVKQFKETWWLPHRFSDIFHVLCSIPCTLHQLDINEFHKGREISECLYGIVDIYFDKNVCRMHFSKDVPSNSEIWTSLRTKGLCIYEEKFEFTYISLVLNCRKIIYWIRTFQSVILCSRVGCCGRSNSNCWGTCLPWSELVKNHQWMI